MWPELPNIDLLEPTWLRPPHGRRSDGQLIVLTPAEVAGSPSHISDTHAAVTALDTLITAVHKARDQHRPAWQQARLAVARVLLPLRRAFVTAAQRVTVPTQAVAARLAAGDVPGAVALVDLLPLATGIQTDVLPILGYVFQQAYAAPPVTVKGVRAAIDAVLTLKLDLGVADPAAVAFMRAHGADLVTAVTDGERVGLRQALADGLRAGLPATQLSVLVKPLIFLLESEEPGGPRHKTAVLNHYHDLIEEGVDEETAQADTDRYANQLRQYRAMMIARTEPAFALVAGKRQMWERAVTDGLVDRADLRKRWATSPTSVHQACIQLNGQEVGFDEPYTLDGQAVDVPLHPHCVCTEVIEVIPSSTKG